MSSAVDATAPPRGRLRANNTGPTELTALQYWFSINVVPQPMPQIRPLPLELASEIKEFQQIGADAIGIDQGAAPAEIVRMIKEKAAHVRAEGQVLDEDATVALGVLLGEQYVREFGWHWAHVNHEDDGDDDNYFVCVLPADNSLSTNPIGWVSSVLSQETPNNILLHFNMVAANRVPPAAPGQALGYH
ncbi:hypothetical protein [Massilia aquatica]|uniref:hypothetical protein n=1 Tax=Massilia aquatica TaxID=2609000 RepID=UPI0014223B2E|nr:hypothetical protein [Massilia aquatica]